MLHKQKKTKTSCQTYIQGKNKKKNIMAWAGGVGAARYGASHGVVRQAPFSRFSLARTFGTNVPHALIK